MTLPFLAQAKTAVNGTDTLTLARPIIDLVAGDQLIAIVCHATTAPGASPVTMATPVGWTSVLSTSNEIAVFLGLDVYTRTSIGAGEAADWAWIASEACDGIAGLFLVYRGLRSNALWHSGSLAETAGAPIVVTAPAVAITAAARAWLLCVFASDNAGTITDPTTLTSRSTIAAPNAMVSAADVELEPTALTLDYEAVASGGNAVIGAQLLFTYGSMDNYKSKILRQSFPPSYDSCWTSNLGKLLTVIGTSDNDIGGLSAEEDFLPDEEP